MVVAGRNRKQTENKKSCYCLFRWSGERHHSVDGLPLVSVDLPDGRASVHPDVSPLVSLVNGHRVSGHRGGLTAEIVLDGWTRVNSCP